MISHIGNLCILIAFFINILNVIFFKSSLRKYFIIFTRLSFIFILISFLCLTLAYLTSDFENLNVFYNSHTKKPLIYKIAGVWSNHEGSLLLWILIMSSYTFIFSYEKSIGSTLKRWTIFFQIIMILGFILFMILTSNPFLTNEQKFDEGMGLNPILQDPALAIHPPLLYLGYVGFSLILSLSIAGLKTNKINDSWIVLTKKYSLFCWITLTAGITVGSFWAYYELGWGGWWFWDPVENASLMPWLSGVALIHSLKAVSKNPQLKYWVVFLSILCFSLSLLGTFLVRSGILVSVHAFANDSSRGIFILLLFFVITGYSFLIFLLKIKKSDQKYKMFFFNRVNAIIINNIIMTITCFTVLLGTIYPLITETITGEKISVGEPYFNSTVLPIFLPGLLLMSIAPSLSWDGKKSKKFKLEINLFAAIIIFLLLIYMLSKINPWGLVGLGLSFWIISISTLGIYKIILKLSNVGFKNIFYLNSALIAHFGVGILILGITCSSIWQKEYIKTLKVGDSMKIHKYDLKLHELQEFKQNNYDVIKGKFTLIKKGIDQENIYPEKRYYPVSKTLTTEAGILHQFWQDIYIVIGDNKDDGWLIKVYHNPLVSFIWIGSFIIIIGGLLSLRNKK